MPTITLSSKGQLTLPVEMRSSLGFKAGDKFIALVEKGAVTLRKIDYPSFWDSYGSLNHLTHGKPLSAAELREAAADAVADDYKRSSGKKP